MLFADLISPEDLRYVDEARVAALEDADAVPACRTVTRLVDMTSVTPPVLRCLEKVFAAFGSQTASFEQRFATREHRAEGCSTRFYEVRNAFVKEQKAADKAADAAGVPRQSIFPFGLQARQWKMALQASCNIMERYWRALQVKAGEKLRKRKVWDTLTPSEQHYVNGLLAYVGDRFFKLLDGGVPEPTKTVVKEGGVRHLKRLCRLVRQVIHECQGALPAHGESRSCWFDSSCYTVKRGRDGRQVLSLMTLEPGKRVEVTLLGEGRVHGTIVLVRHDEGYAVHVLEKIRVKPVKVTEHRPGKLRCRALDMGFTEAFTDEEGKVYAGGLGELLTAYAKLEDAMLQKRNELRDLSRTTVNGKTRRNVIRYNLGTKGQDEFHRVWKARILNCVNAGLNKLMKDANAEVLVVEALSGLFRMEGINKKVRNRLSRWTRGLIDERLAFKAAVHGVRIVKIAASYSSQCCPRCAFTARANRSSNDFKCKHCGRMAQADQNAALGLLMRMHDPFFKRYTKKEAVKEYLRKRYEALCRERGETPKDPPPASSPGSARKKRPNRRERRRLAFQAKQVNP